MIPSAPKEFLKSLKMLPSCDQSDEETTEKEPDDAVFIL